MNDLIRHTHVFTSERDGKSQVELNGYIVPGTDGLFMIDQRYPAIGFEEEVWYITHIPTSRHMQGKVAEINSRERAAQVAKRIFDEFCARGWNLNTADGDSIKASVRMLTADEQRALWERIGA